MFPYTFNRGHTKETVYFDCLLEWDLALLVEGFTEHHFHGAFLSCLPQVFAVNMYLEHSRCINKCIKRELKVGTPIVIVLLNPF